jgi:hypothetical protein
MVKAKQNHAPVAIDSRLSGLNRIDSQPWPPTICMIRWDLPDLPRAHQERRRPSP